MKALALVAVLLVAGCNTGCKRTHDAAEVIAGDLELVADHVVPSPRLTPAQTKQVDQLLQKIRKNLPLLVEATKHE